jgi:hypothetical protein
MAKIIFEFFIRIGSHSQGPHMQDFRIEESLGVGFDKMDQGSNQILGLAAGCADEDSIPPMDVAEDLLLGDKFLGVPLPHFVTNSIRRSQDHLPDSFSKVNLAFSKGRLHSSA